MMMMIDLLQAGRKAADHWWETHQALPGWRAILADIGDTNHQVGDPIYKDDGSFWGVCIGEVGALLVPTTPE